MDIKKTATYQFLKARDIEANEMLRGNRSETISAQTARGLRARTRVQGKNQSMDMAHGNMLLGGAGIMGGVSLMKKDPVLGGILMFAGALITIVTMDDWKNGKL